MEIGFLHGRGALGDDARLDLQLLDQALVPGRGDAVVTWGSRNGAPYVSGIPVGEVTAVYSNVRDSSQRAVVQPLRRLRQPRRRRGRGALGHRQRPGADRGRGGPAMTPAPCGWSRSLGAVLALVLQTTFFSHLSWPGVVPNLCLLLVVGVALVRGSEFAMVLGFVAGLLLDLAPPADHLAGRWALALIVVGYVAGRVRQDVRPSGRLGAWPPSRPAPSSAPRSSP